MVALIVTRLQWLPMGRGPPPREDGPCPFRSARTWMDYWFWASQESVNGSTVLPWALLTSGTVILKR